MRAISLAHEEDFDGWREAARGLALARIPPHEVTWRIGDALHDLFGEEGAIGEDDAPAFRVPRAFEDLARSVMCHSSPERFSLLYVLLLRVRANRTALEDYADPLVQRLECMAREVRRDIHKMHAFVRFREVEEEDCTRLVAWFEPDHHIVRSTASFFVRRFARMRWSILTPELSIHWDGQQLTESPGATRAEAPSSDAVEETWKTYYASIFNPARVKVKAMTREMPKKYWRNMPETMLVNQLIAGAQKREAEMVERSQAKAAVDGLAVFADERYPAGGNPLAAWEALVTQARTCKRCPLYSCSTQTVFGEGPLDARLMFVGEQPGDQEDLAGRPFVGPAGQLFDRALLDAGVDRSEAYVTNAVKHFKFEQRGKRRLHSKPSGPEIEACRWWIGQERALIRPRVTVALGATAARSIFGGVATISAMRGRPHQLDEGEAWVTVHPSYLLRIQNNKETEYARFVDDLRIIRERVKALS